MFSFLNQYLRTINNGKHPPKVSLLLLLSLLNLQTNSALASVHLNSHKQFYSVGSDLRYLIDTKNEITINNITSLDHSHFTNNINNINNNNSSSNTLNLGYSSSNIWIKLDVDASKIANTRNPYTGKRTTQFLKQWVVEVDSPNLDEVIFFRRNKEGTYSSLITGDRFNFSQRDINTNTFAFNVQLSENTLNTFYFRIKSQGSLRIPINIYSKSEFSKQLQLKNTGYSLYAGILFAVLFVSILFFLTVRERIYLYFSLYVSSFILFQLSFLGLGPQYLWQDTPQWSIYSMDFSIACIGLFGALFTQQFLNTKHMTPTLHKYLGIIALSAIGLAIWSVLARHYSIEFRPGILMSIITMFTILTVGIIHLTQKHLLARYFSLASFAIITGSLIDTLTIAGQITPISTPSFITAATVPIPTYSVSLMSTILFALIMLLALVDRLYLLGKENIKHEEQARQNLIVENENLSRSSKIKDKFLATVSNELRTPMNGIIGNIDLMKSTEVSEQLTGYLGSASDSAASMVLMIEELLGYSEAQSGSIILEHKPFELRESLKSLDLAIARLCQHKKLEFKFKVDSDVPESLFGDHKRLNQLLSIMLDNAVKFTEEGEIGFHTTLIQSKDSTQQAHICFTIWDTGIGIPRPMQDQIFESFFQTDSTINKEHAGLGIGLATCKHLAALFNGNIEVSSKEDEGSRFNIHVRLDQSSESIDNRSEITVEKIERPLVKTLDILIVEDNPVSLMLLKGILQKLHYRVHTASNGQEALNFAYIEHADCILMDLEMPTMDGFDACKAIRHLEQYENIPIIAVTSNTTIEDEEHSYGAGMNDFLTKPINISIIEYTLDKWLKYGGMDMQNSEPDSGKNEYSITKSSHRK